MTDFASSVLESTSRISGCLFVAGYIDGLLVTLLSLGSLVGLFLKSVSAVYMRVLGVLTIVLALCSTIIATAYIAEIWIALRSANRFEWQTYLAVRWGPLSVYSVIYWLAVATNFLPLLFWWTRFRTKFLSIFVIASLASFGIWFERLVIAITSAAQDHLPASW